MNDAVLVLNAGSATIKFAVYEVGAAPRPECRYRGQVEGDPAAALPSALEQLRRHDTGWNLVAAGHRVVHGGDRFCAPVAIDAEVVRELERLCPLAPLHQPHNLAAIRALAQARPALAQVACFDTAFHQTQTELARRYALPRELTEGGVKRYGFHGLSYEYVASRLPSVLGERAAGRAIVAHLGNGASLCALEAGRSVATTMGFTALEGLVMGTRSGSLDPGVLLYLMDEKGMSSADLGRLLYRESGLLGVSGVSQDMRALLASDDPRARLAVDLFVYRVVREIGSLAAALRGLDALIFTAGIGERAAPVRAEVCAALGWLGVELDEAANLLHGPVISSASSRVAVAVVPTDEEEMIARHTAGTLSRCQGA